MISQFIFVLYLQHSCGSIRQHLDGQNSRTGSHLLAAKLLLGAEVQQDRVRSQQHLGAVPQTCSTALHLNDTCIHAAVACTSDVLLLSCGRATCTTSLDRPQVNFPELKYHVWVVLRRESGLLSISGSKLSKSNGDKTDDAWYIQNFSHVQLTPMILSSLTRGPFKLY